MAARLTHLDDEGSARMVDVGDKPATDRRAVARAVVRMSPATAAAVAAGDGPKGDVMGTARIAGIQAAKRTADLIPLCHPLALSRVEVDLSPAEDASSRVLIEARVGVTGQTGVEMEALTAATVALLTVYDMAKSIDKSMVLSDISLASKVGGGGGEYTRLDGTPVAP